MQQWRRDDILNLCDDKEKESFMQKSYECKLPQLDLKTCEFSIVNKEMKKIVAMLCEK